MSDEALPTFESNGERWKAVVFLESDRSTWHMMRPEELVALVAALPDEQRAKLFKGELLRGYRQLAAALHNEMPPGFVELDTDKIVGRVGKLVAELTAENARLREALAHARMAERERCARACDENAKNLEIAAREAAEVDMRATYLRHLSESGTAAECAGIIRMLKDEP